MVYWACYAHIAVDHPQISFGQQAYIYNTIHSHTKISGFLNHNFLMRLTIPGPVIWLRMHPKGIYSHPIWCVQHESVLFEAKKRRRSRLPFWLVYGTLYAVCRDTAKYSMCMSSCHPFHRLAALPTEIPAHSVFVFFHFQCVLDVDVHF